MHNNDDHWHELPGEDNIVPTENDNGPLSTPASPTQATNVYRPTPQRNIHPHINGNFLLALLFFINWEFKGQPCDKDGLFLPPGTSPLPHSGPSLDTWDPFDE